MPVAFNHTIVYSRDPRESAAFFSEILGLPSPRRFGPFLAVPLEHGATFDFIRVAAGESVQPQHYAFLVTEQDFDEIYGRIVERGIEHRPDPHSDRRNEINRNDGGRGVYWCDPDGHFLEIFTVPYGGWPPGSDRRP